MDYEVKNAPLPVLICKLQPGESIDVNVVQCLG